MPPLNFERAIWRHSDHHEKRLRQTQAKLQAMKQIAGHTMAAQPDAGRARADLTKRTLAMPGMGLAYSTESTDCAIR